MTSLKEYHKLVVGKTLTNLFFTKQNGPHDYMPGIPPAYYFSTIMELDNNKRLRFGNDFVVDWEDDEPIITLTNENWNLPSTLIFKKQRIIDLTQDEEQQLTFHLENGTTIAHTMDYGDQLFIQNENIFTKEMKANLQITAPETKLPKLIKSWLQNFLGR